MRRFAMVAAITAAAIGAVAPPAAAHLSFQIVGYHFVWTDGFSAGHSGYVGPQRISDGPANDGLDSVTNRDPVPHTFTVDGGAIPAISLAPGASAPLPDTLPPGTYTFGCTIHTFMRGEFTIQ